MTKKSRRSVELPNERIFHSQENPAAEIPKYDSIDAPEPNVKIEKGKARPSKSSS